jgi:glucosamine-6-phosphate deaminase
MQFAPAVELTRDRLMVRVYDDRAAMGAAAAVHVSDRVATLQERRPRASVRLIFAAAASQLEFLDALAQSDRIDWGRVVAFHLDEYVGLARDDDRSFGRWLMQHLFGRVHPGRVELLDGTASDPATECRRYGALIADGGIDLALVGIGENGHVAFNDPSVADFDDPEVVKPVEIDAISRAQQVRDGAFAAIDDVPTDAMTVTMSTILASREISVVVPGAAKAGAVARTLDGPIETACPASALRRHPDVVVYADRAAISLARGAP